MLATAFRIPQYKFADNQLPDGLYGRVTFTDRARLAVSSTSAILMTEYTPDDALFDELDAPRLAKPFGISILEAALTKVRYPANRRL